MALADNIILVGVIALTVGFVYLYVTTRQYLRQGFQDSSGNPIPLTLPKVVVLNQPYTTQAIRGADDYELSSVFQNESEKELSTGLRNKLMSQYPMDWSSQPPSSAVFQKGQRQMFQDQKGQRQIFQDQKGQREMFQNQQTQNPQWYLGQQVTDSSGNPVNLEGKPVEAVTGPLDASGNPYEFIEDNAVMPPDTLAVEQHEKKILQTYQPKHAGDLTTYNVDDAMELIRKIYDQKGEVPQVVRKKNNVYEVVGTRKKNEQVVYEETDQEAPASTDPVVAIGENMTVVPQTAKDTNAALDPFYSMDSTNRGRWNYRSWTPGLERMFPPTEPRENWY